MRSLFQQFRKDIQEMRERQKSQQHSRDGQFFVVMFGWILLSISLVTLFFFFSGDIYMDFWSFRWTISIVFIVGLLSAGIGIVRLGTTKQATFTMMTIFGMAYVTVGILVYVYLGFRQVFRSPKLDAYLGLIVIFAVLVGIGLLCLFTVSRKLLVYPAYGFATANVAFVVMLIIKYVFDANPFKAAVFLGEVVILIVGSLLFLGLFVASERK